MHFRHTVDPTPLKLITTMNYGNYQDMPEYYGIDLHRAPPTHYAPYARPPMPPVKYEPIVPNENDILMGRGGKNNQHTGNEKFRKLARLDAKAYSTSSKKIKSNIARGLVMKVRNMQPAGRFLKRNPVTTAWEDVGNEYAREKASQVLRDAVALLPEASDDASESKKREAEPEAEEAPELKSEPHSTNIYTKPPAAKRQRLMTPAANPPAYHSSYATTSPGWQYQHQTPMTPTLTPPTLKRLRSNNWFERAAFFQTPHSPTTPTLTNLTSTGRSDSSRPFGVDLSFLASPTTLSRQGSLFSLGNGSLPGENFLLTSNHDKGDLDLSQIDGSSDEFFTDFY